MASWQWQIVIAASEKCFETLSCFANLIISYYYTLLYVQARQLTIENQSACQINSFSAW